jgi:hypothetical protein
MRTALNGRGRNCARGGANGGAMNADDAPLWLWLVIFLAPTIVAVARGRRLRWQCTFNLLSSGQ